MHRLNKDARILRVDILMDAVTKVKDMAFALAEAGENSRHFLFNTRGGSIPVSYTHLTLPTID